MKRTFALLAALVAVSATAAAAQPGNTATGTASATINSSIRIDVTNTTVTFGTIDTDDFDAGFANGAATSSISHRGNVRHSVYIKANAATFTGANGTSTTDPVRTSKPASDLLWSLNAFSSAGTGLTTSDAALVSNAARGRHDNAATVSYRMLLDYADDTPGSYSLGFTYTVAPS